jgi:hypothetical protein
MPLTERESMVMIIWLPRRAVGYLRLREKVPKLKNMPLAHPLNHQMMPLSYKQIIHFFAIFIPYYPQMELLLN